MGDKQKTGPCFGECEHSFKILSEAKPAFIRAFIAKADKDLLKHFSDVALNLLKGNIQLSEQQRAELKPQKNMMKRLACCTSKEPRRRILQTRGQSKFVKALARLALMALKQYNSE